MASDAKMASKVLIYLTPVIICIIVLYLSSGVEGQTDPRRGKTFLFDRNNKNLERKRNINRRTEEERALRRQQVGGRISYSLVDMFEDST